jgi:lysophospholipase L1-like esterase
MPGHLHDQGRRDAVVVGLKKLLMNICIALVSTSISLAVVYYIYSSLSKTADQVTYKETESDYLLSFYNRKGQKIGESDGLLKITTDPFTIYTNYPNQKTARYSIDEHGFRAGYTSEKPFTAIVIGGSAAFGFALGSDDNTFASLMSRQSQKFNVLNSAVVGFLSGQELSQMIHYLDNFRPDLYIVFDGWNDIYDPYAFTKTWPVRNAPIGYNNAFLQMEGRLAEYFLVGKEDIKKEEIAPAGNALGEGEYFQKIVHEYVSNIAKMHAFATSRGAHFLLVFQPELGNKKIRSPTEEESLRAWIEKYGYLNSDITNKYKTLIVKAKDRFREHSIDFIDINDQPEFAETPQTVFFDVVHPNKLGHELIAQIINRVLEEKF